MSRSNNPVEPGEEMNVRKVHAALWRETAEPTEHGRRLPWLLVQFFIILGIFALIYLFIQDYDWNEYESNSRLRLERDHQPATSPAPPAAPPSAPPTP